jgi:hypothetical protein
LCRLTGAWIAAPEFRIAIEYAAVEESPMINDALIGTPPIGRYAAVPT